MEDGFFMLFHPEEKSERERGGSEGQLVFLVFVLARHSFIDQTQHEHAVLTKERFLSLEGFSLEGSF